MSSDRDPRDGLRRVRRMSNWTAVALLVGTGATTVALAHEAVSAAPATAPAGWGASTGSGAAVTNAAGGPRVVHPVATTSASGVTTTTSTGAGVSAVSHGTSAPRLAHSVATTSASGVTTTTTTRIVNGRTVVTQVRHVPAFHDD